VTAKARVLNAPSVCRLDTLAAGRVEVTCPLTSFQGFLTSILTKCYAVGGSSVESLGRYMINMKVSVLPQRLRGRRQRFDWLVLQSGVVTIRTVCLKKKCTLVQALRLCTGRTAHRGSRGLALLFLDHGTRKGMRGQRHAPTAFYPGKTRYPLYKRLGEP